uniref:Epsin-2 n=1 Tax=Plectus sambesii TaxID=2011161 RepID=A0A914WQC6_9BILA
MMARKRFAQNNQSISSDGLNHRMPKSDTYADPELEEVRPSSIGEEELQLQIALAMSREESQREEELRKGDDIRLQMALSESRKADSIHSNDSHLGAVGGAPPPQSSGSAIDDLLSLNLGASSNSPAYNTATASASPWGAGAGAPAPDPWMTNGASAHPPADPWAPTMSTSAAPSIRPTNDPWATPVLPKTNGSPVKAVNDPWAPFDSDSPRLGEFDGLNGMNNGQHKASMNLSDSVFDTNGLSSSLPLEDSARKQRSNVKTPETFLGENSALVNLDNLMGPSNSLGAAKASNPFLSSTQPTNPFEAQQRPSPTLNQMRAQGINQPSTSTPAAAGSVDWGLPQPLQPQPSAAANNPFL